MSALPDERKSQPAPAEPDLASLLRAAEELKAADIKHELLDLEQRTREQRFFVACLGQFKRGKSTLLDALIGSPVLPTGILPVTTVPTIVRYATGLSARVRLRSGDWVAIEPRRLEEFVSEEKNPQNRKAVSAVELCLDSPLLACGMCLVDTPGLGSIFETSTEATRSFIPHIDAAMIVIGADPPLSGDELALAESVSTQVRDLIIVLNKADRATEAERQAAADFARRAFEARLRRGFERVYEISATEWLQSATPTRDAPQLIDRLGELGTRSGAALARAARARGAERASRELTAIIAERRGALSRPLEKSRHRIAALREHAASAETSLRDLSPLLGAEERRIAQSLSARRDRFLQVTVAQATAELRDRIRAVPLTSGPKYRRELMRIAQGVAREMVLPWLKLEQDYAEEAYRNGVARFHALALHYVAQISDSLGVPELSNNMHSLSVAEELDRQSGFRFYDIIRIAQPASPFGFLRDHVLGTLRVRKRFHAAAADFLGKLLVTNSSRAENDFKERIANSRMTLEKKIRALLTHSIQHSELALSAAESLMRSGEQAVADELARLHALETSLR